MERIEYEINICPVNYRDNLSKKLDENYDAFSYARKSIVDTGNKKEDKCLHHIFFLGKMACHFAGMTLEESVIRFFKNPVIKDKAIYDSLVKKGILRMEEYKGKNVYFPNGKACKLAHLYDKKNLTYI